MAPTPEVIASSLRDADPTPYWLDTGSRPAPAPPLSAATTADLVVVGGGFTGLWTALLAKEADPSRDVVVLEGERIGWAASGRNGGFCDASLTHGTLNGVDRFPNEMDTLERLGAGNLDAIEATLLRHGIDCGFTRPGALSVATERYQLPHVAEAARVLRRFGHEVDLLDVDEVRAEIDSPTFLGGLWHRRAIALVDPARLAWGLAAACRSLGVRVFEGTRADAIDDDRSGVVVRTGRGSVRAGRVALATNAFPPLLRRIRHYVVPVWDYVLMTEPLSADQRASIGWASGQGLSDSGNQFHYSRLTDDGRILWGGYDAIYHFANRTGDELADRPESFELLARHLLETFPQLDGIRFTHRWGGVIDTSSRFSVLFGRAHRGRVAYAVGYTGLGVGASRFGGAVLLDLLDGADTERIRLSMVRRRPVPFPPEPLRWLVVEQTRRSLARADRLEGHEDLWLRVLGRLGLGFDS